MVRSPLVVESGDSLTEFVTRVIGSNQTTGAVVDDGTRLRGVISLLDVYRRIVPGYLHGKSRLADVLHAEFFTEKFERFRLVPVTDVMTRDVDFVAPGDTVMSAIAMFVQRGRKALPVVDSGSFAGIITRRSILRSMVEGAGATPHDAGWGL